MPNIILRRATPEDAPAMLEIFRYYVEHTAVTFAYEPPSPESFREALCRRLERYPCLVAEEEGSLLGYAYASPFKAGDAYDWAVETTLYLRRDVQGRGLGRLLHDGLEKALRRQNILLMNACIAVTDLPDPHLTNQSMEFHTHMGYRVTARFDRCGYKFHRWYDMIWMEKALGDRDRPPLPVIPFPQVEDFEGEISSGL